MLLSRCGEYTDAVAAAHLHWGDRTRGNHDDVSPFHGVPRHGGCVTSCCVSWPTLHWCAPHSHHLNWFPRVLSTANVVSCEPQGCPPSCRGGVRCLSVIVPTTDHISSFFSTLQAGSSDLSIRPSHRKQGQAIRRVSRPVARTRSPSALPAWK